jgi:chromosome segregation ATPase
LHPLPPFD